MITKKILRVADDPSRQKNKGGGAAVRDEERALKTLASGLPGGQTTRHGGRTPRGRNAGTKAPRAIARGAWAELAAYLVEGERVPGTGEREAPGGDGRVGHVAARNFPWRADGAPVMPGDVHELFDWMSDTAAQNQRANKNTALHYVVSLPTADAHKARPELWEDYLSGALETLGLDEHQAVAVEHRDTDNPHIHLVINRVHPVTFKVADPFFDLARFDKFNRQFERKHSLKVEPGRFIDPATLERRKPGAPRPAKRRQGQRIDGEKLARAVKARLKEASARPFSEAKNWAELERKLSENGLQLRASGRGFALIDTDTGGEVKASKVGGKAANREALERQFGESWGDWSALRAEAAQAGVDLDAARAARKAQAEAAWAAERQRARARIESMAGRPWILDLPETDAVTLSEREASELIADMTPNERARTAKATAAKLAELRARGDRLAAVQAEKALARLERALGQERGQDAENSRVQTRHHTAAAQTAPNPAKAPKGPKNGLGGDLSPFVPLAVPDGDAAAKAAAQNKIKAMTAEELAGSLAATRAAQAALKKTEPSPHHAAKAEALRAGQVAIKAEFKARGLEVPTVKGRTTTRSKSRGWGW